MVVMLHKCIANRYHVTMEKKVTKKEIQQFRKAIYSHFKSHGRDLPWRNTQNPYHILVSEVMLQQTQVDRTIPKYREFMRAFPTILSLATAPTRKVLLAWQGMGYNRRALNLQKCAQEIVARHKGQVPDDFEGLVSLPGIGPYTARAILAFAFNVPSVLIETNVRTVYLHHFFPKQNKVSDAQLLPLIEQTLDTKNPRQWYSALMDYGSSLKKSLPNPSRRSAHHTKQSKFEGSLRQARGAILKVLLHTKKATRFQLQTKTSIESKRMSTALRALCDEKMISSKKGVYKLAR